MYWVKNTDLKFIAYSRIVDQARNEFNDKVKNYGGIRSYVSDSLKGNTKNNDVFLMGLAGIDLMEAQKAA